MTLTQQLIKSVLAHGTTFHNITDGPYQEECPCCGSSKDYKGKEPIPTMFDIIHELDCPWILAKKLQQEEFPEMLL